MDVIDAILKRRTIRRFTRDRVDREILIEFVDYARLAPSTLNYQALEFIVVDEVKTVDEMFNNVKLALFLPEDQRPTFDERPAAYIVILANTDVMKKNFERDVGAAAENILLGALARGLGGVLMWSVDRDAVRRLLNVPDKYVIDSAIALGRPAEEAKIVEPVDGSLRYYRDDKGVHNVPKRPLKTILHLNGF
ncbi:MAG: nitroreductase family protein [Deltaproteobacteria bacterium]|uniref:Nitroreductase family protein n=1 Tax=Candidatus Zymogenus saltonus TaxID=2844893 RepID=A0A9D8KEL9_9DELT|nr:nitroreductase family protein [Candidatus Zymogenus saltonus]